MAYCSKCGAELQNGATFCTKCGTAVSTNGFESDFDAHYYQNILDQSKAEYEKYLSRKWLAVVFVLAFGAGGWMFWSSGGFFNCLISIFLWMMCVVSIYTFFFTFSYYGARLKKISTMTAHDLYIEQKKNSEMWQTIGNGAKAVNAGLKIFQLFS